MDRDPPTMWNDTEPDDAAAAELLRLPRGARVAAPCPPPELVQAARAGVLPEALQERIARHVERCRACQALGEALDDASVGTLTAEEHERILARVRTGLAPSTRPWFRNRRWPLYAAAAGVALAIGSLLMWQFRGAPTASAPPQVALNRQPATAPPVFRLVKPAIQGPGAPDILLRGSPKPGEAEDLARALEPYRTDAFAEVARRLRAVISRHPQSAAGYFYLGVSEMFLDRNAEAVTALQAADRLAKNDANLGREIAWYLALAYHRSGQSGRAADALNALCTGQGPRSARACVAIRELAGPLTLSGVVTGRGGVPLAGARVSEWTVRLGADFNVAFPTGLTATTDSTGHYTVTGLLTSRSPQVIMVALKPGYFSIGKILSISGDTQIDFVLDPWVHISLGEVVRGTVQPGDTVCGEPNSNERCHYYALTVSAGGTLEVSLASPKLDSTWDLHVETPAGDAYGPPIGAAFPLRVAIPAEAKSTYQIRVVSISPDPRAYELTTRLR
jgi:cytochrome c-type biogenesis protein CcmH/NrfG